MSDHHRPDYHVPSDAYYRALYDDLNNVAPLIDGAPAIDGSIYDRARHDSNYSASDHRAADHVAAAVIHGSGLDRAATNQYLYDKHIDYANEHRAAAAIAPTDYERRFHLECVELHERRAISWQSIIGLSENGSSPDGE